LSERHGKKSNFIWFDAVDEIAWSIPMSQRFVGTLALLCAAQFGKALGGEGEQQFVMNAAKTAVAHY